MRRRILDSSILVAYWCHRHGQASSKSKIVHAKQWAKELIDLYGTNAIVTPVAVEFLSGFCDRQQMEAGQAFLAEFRCIDEQRIPEEDWKRARQLAERIPRSRRRRHLGDCLIRAIADRLGYEVHTSDTGFPR